MKSTHIYYLSVATIVVLVAVHTLSVQAIRRDIAQDERTAAAVNTLSRAAEAYYGSEQELAESTEELRLTAEERQTVTAAALEYEKKSNSEYTICAHFNRSSDGQDFELSPVSLLMPSESDYSFSPNPDVDPYEHAAGRECFDYETQAGLRFFGDFDSGRDGEDTINQDQVQGLEELFGDPSNLENSEFQVQ